jgi:hypothetical protein
LVSPGLRPGHDAVEVATLAASLILSVANPAAIPATRTAAWLPIRRQLPARTGLFLPKGGATIGHDTVRVASYMADPNGLLSKKPRVAAARTPTKGARTRGPAAAHLAVLSDPRVLDASAAAAALLHQVDFPEFVSDLIQGTFNSILNASIEQMKAYGKLIEQVAKAVDRFKEDSISDAQARDWLAQRFAAQLELDPRGRLRWCVAPHVGAKGLASALLMSSPSAHTRDFVAAARRRLAIDRQQLLSTMVMMGINRVVVTDGKIVARVGDSSE